MYAQLGDIRFERMLSPEKYSDSQETEYAEHALIKNKPKLVPVGEKLDEIQMSIHFHTAFCNPEEQFKKLSDHRKNNEILPLIWGNGTIQGDFVITSLKRNIDALGFDGGLWDISVDISLKEAYNPNPVDNDKKLALSKAFATNENVPLPTNIVSAPGSVAVEAVNFVGAADLQTDSATDKMDQAVKEGNAYNTLIAKAQGFVEALSTKQSAVLASINTVSDLMNKLNIKMTANPKLGLIATGLAAQLSASQVIVTNAQILISSFSTMPNPVTTTSQALNVIGIMGNTAQTIIDLKNTLKDLRDKAEPLMTAVATRVLI